MTMTQKFCAILLLFSVVTWGWYGLVFCCLLIWVIQLLGSIEV